MPASQAKAGPGFLIDYFDGSGWVHVGEVQDIDLSGDTTNTDDVTNQDSDSGYMEFLGTLQDGGSVTFPMNLVAADAGQIALQTLKQARTVVPWRIQMVDTGWWTHFRGLITNLGRTFPLNKAMKRNVTIKVSGPVQETESAEVPA